MSKTQKEIVREDVKQYAEIEAIANMNGGKTIIKGLKNDVLAVISTLTSSYDTLSHTELIANCAKLKERIDLYNTFMNASKSAKYARIALEKILEVDPDIED